ncbi:Metallo-hydrolase/oxidoreductase [Thozetella sp. PMI_491]|nr:Metallo-hydrolase/oxidoreductase [Thozetella sp. PMI_491]
MTAYMKLALLPSGFLTLPQHFFCADQEDKNIRELVPSMSFLLKHPRTGQNVIFDLGMRKVLEDYPADIQPHLKTRQPIETVPDACDSLRKGGLEPSEIDAVILSHVHYDHVGNPRDFTNAKFIVGYGTRHLLQHGMNYHSAAKFEKDLLPPERTIELPIQKELPNLARPVENHCRATSLELSALVPGNRQEWKSLGPFDNTIDLFGDGLVYIVDSPGHLAGHLNVAVRVADKHWIYLAGDACHHTRILDGLSAMASWNENETIERIRKFREGGLTGSDRVDVALAHDNAFWKAHQHAIWPSHF